MSRIVAQHCWAAGILDLYPALGARPERYGMSSRFGTMPSKAHIARVTSLRLLLCRAVATCGLCESWDERASSDSRQPARCIEEDDHGDYHDHHRDDYVFVSAGPFEDSHSSLPEILGTTVAASGAGRELKSRGALKRPLLAR